MQPVTSSNLISNFSLEPVPTTKEVICNKIKTFAKNFFFIALGAAFFVTNPTVFAISFIVGMVFDEKTEEIVDRIGLVFRRQPWHMLLITVVGGYLSLPVTWGALSMLYAAKLGSWLSLSAKRKEEEVHHLANSQ